MKSDYMYLLVMTKPGGVIDDEHYTDIFMSKKDLRDYIDSCTLDHDLDEINGWTIFTIDKNSGWHVKVEQITTIGGLDD